MKSLIIIALTIGCALARKPSVWDDSQCPPYNELEEYIIKGEEAADGKFPYMLSLRERGGGKSNTCGASILTKNWALTAAHCCDIKGKLSLYAGSNSLSKGGTTHPVEFKKIHENYTPKNNWTNDICLLKVKEPFVMDSLNPLS